MRTALLFCVCLATACAPSRSSPALDRSGEQIVLVEDRSGTLVRAPLRFDDQTQRADLALNFETAWTRLPQVLEEIGLSVGTIDESVGYVGQSGERVSRIDGKRMSTYLDCGMGVTAEPYANLYEVTLSYEVLIDKQEVGSSLNAEMRIEATARPRDVRGNPLSCRSKRTLERLVFARLQAEGWG